MSEKLVIDKIIPKAPIAGLSDFQPISKRPEPEFPQYQRITTLHGPRGLNLDLSAKSAIRTGLRKEGFTIPFDLTKFRDVVIVIPPVVEQDAPPETPQATDPDNTVYEAQTALPQDDYVRVHIDGEEEKRAQLLESVYVEDGIAHGISRTGVHTKLVAVRIGDDKRAEIVPFSLGRDVDGERTVQILLPSDKPSRIGFFLAYDDADQSVAATVRAGLYPGIPQIWQGEKKKYEVKLNLGGIKPREEQEEQDWADQIGLDALGFPPNQRRGIFNRSSRPNGTDFWENEPFLMIPEEYDDMFAHLDRDRVKGDTMQIQFYTQTPIEDEPLPAFNRFLGLGETRGTQMRSYGQPLTRSFGSKSLGLAYGRGTLREGKTTRSESKDIVGAFRVVAVSKN